MLFRSRYAADSISIWKIRIPRFYLGANVIDEGIAPPYASPAFGNLLIAQDGDTRSALPLEAEARAEPKWITSLMDLYNSERDKQWMLYNSDPR